jgi:hypothetical protein
MPSIFKQGVKPAAFWQALEAEHPASAATRRFGPLWFHATRLLVPFLLAGSFTALALLGYVWDARAHRTGSRTRRAAVLELEQELEIGPDALGWRLLSGLPSSAPYKTSPTGAHAAILPVPLMLLAPARTEKAPQEFDARVVSVLQSTSFPRGPPAV